MKLPKFRIPVLSAKAPHRLVCCGHRGGCDYNLVWDDGYRTTYSAAVQLGYHAPDVPSSVSISEDGTRVNFPDGTVLSAELIRVDAMQKAYKSTMVVLVFSAALLAAIYWLLYSGAFVEEYTTAAYAGIGALCSVSALPMYRTRCYLVNYIGLVCTVVGAILSVSLTAGVLLVYIGFALQMVYIWTISRLASAGFDS